MLTGKLEKMASGSNFASGSQSRLFLNEGVLNFLKWREKAIKRIVFLGETSLNSRVRQGDWAGSH